VASNGTGGSGAPSLGEVAAKYKSERPQNIRTYTNADALRLSDGMNVHGANVNPVSAQNSVPPSPPLLPSASSGTQSSSSAQLSASARPSPGTPAPIAQASSGQSTAQASAEQNHESPTTPQVSESAASDQNSKANNGTRLPASATLLPLFGVLGIAFGAVGLWLRKYFG
jgi:hypothetical protein